LSAVLLETTVPEVVFLYNFSSSQNQIFPQELQDKVDLLQCSSVKTDS